MKIVVVESPAKAKTINKYLGKDYMVLASVGLPTAYPAGVWPSLREAMGVDKKARGARLRLVVLDGVTNFPGRAVKPVDARIAEWATDLDKTAARKIRHYSSVAEGAERIRARNRRLTPEQALHLATHALKRSESGGSASGTSKSSASGLGNGGKHICAIGGADSGRVAARRSENATTAP